MVSVLNVICIFSSKLPIKLYYIFVKNFINFPQKCPKGIMKPLPKSWLFPSSSSNHLTRIVYYHPTIPDWPKLPEFGMWPFAGPFKFFQFQHLLLKISIPAFLISGYDITILVISHHISLKALDKINGTRGIRAREWI